MLMAAVNDLVAVAKALIAGSADVNQASTSGHFATSAIKEDSFLSVACLGQANGKGESLLSVSEKNGFREVVPRSG